MGKLFGLACVLLLFFCPVLAEDRVPVLDPGGVSFAVNKAVPESSAADSHNYVVDSSFDQAAHTPKSQTWGTLTCIHAKNFSHEMKNTVDRAVTSQVVTDENPYYRLKTLPSIRKYQTPEGLPMISNRLSQTIPWNGNAARVKLTFRGRGGIAPGSTVKGWQGLFFFAYFWGKQRYVPVAKEYSRSIPLTDDFKTISFEFNVPQGTKHLFLEFSLYHAAEADLDDITLTQVTEYGLEAAVFPFYVYPGEAFHIEKGVSAVLDVRLKRNDNSPIQSPELVMELPEGFDVIGVNQPNRIISVTTEKKIRRIRIDIGTSVSRNMAYGSYARWGGVDVVIKSNLPSSGEFYSCRYFVINNAEAGKVKILPLRVVEPGEKGKIPKKFVSGASGFDLMFDSNTTDDLLNAFTDFGFNAVKGNFNAESVKATEKYHIGTYGEIWHIMNGYRLGAKNKPLDVAFLQEDGTPFVEEYGNAGHICPVEVYTRGPYYREFVLKKQMRNYVVERGVWSYMAVNWEPCNSEKGCFCPRCMNEFIRYSGLPAAEVKKSWPKEMKIKYYDLWRKFRSYQHGLLVAMLDRDMKDLAASINKEGAFIPILEYSSLTSWWNSDFQAYNPDAYLDRIRFIQPFGPYFFYHTGLGGDQYFPGIHYLTFAAARECNSFIAKKIPEKSKRPFLFGYPLSQEFAGNAPWVTEPEALVFDTLCFYLNQWKGSFAYLFPYGYDHRWFRAMSNAHAQIAATEEIVMEGDADNSFFNVKTISPIPSGDILASYRKDAYMFTTLRQPQVKNIQLILFAGFRKENEYLVALGNSWIKSEVFLSLSLTLPSERQWRVTIPDKRILLGTFSSAELAKGILVHTGALRWEFYRVEPENGNPPKDLFKLEQEHIRSEYLKRLPLMKKTAKAEDAFILQETVRNQKLSGEKKFHEDIKAVSNNGISITPSKERNLLFIRTPEYEATLNPGNGASIVSLKRNGKEFVCQKPLLGLGRDSFLLPHAANKMPVLPFSVVAVIPEKNSVLAKLSCSITQEMNSVFNGLIIQKNVLFSDRKIQFGTVLRNESNKGIAFVFRYHNLPECLTLENSKGGKVVFEGDNLSFGRMMTNHLHKVDKRSQDEIDKVLDATTLAGSVSGKIKLFSRTGEPELVFSPAEKDLYGVYFWEGNNVGLSAVASVEFIYGKQYLKPDEEWHSSLLINLDLKE